MLRGSARSTGARRRMLGKLVRGKVKGVAFSAESVLGGHIADIYVYVHLDTYLAMKELLECKQND